MAQFSSAFDSNPLGAIVGWSGQWHTLIGGASFAIVAEDIPVTGKVFGDRCVGINNNINSFPWMTPSALSFNAVGSGNADVDVLMRVDGRYSTTEYPTGIVIRGSGDDTTENGYFVHFRYSGSEFKIDKFINGDAGTTVASSPFTLGEDIYPYGSSVFSWYYVRFQAIGSALKAKYWQEGKDEPATWHIEVTDTDIPGAGWVGMCITNGAASPRDGYVDWFSVGTGGSDTPPAPPAGEGASRLTQAALEVLRSGSPDARVTQAALEVLRSGNPGTRITQAALEVLRSGEGSEARITQAALEVLRSGEGSEARITQLALEVLRSRQISTYDHNTQFIISG